MANATSDRLISGVLVKRCRTSAAIPSSVARPMGWGSNRCPAYVVYVAAFGRDRANALTNKVDCRRKAATSSKLTASEAIVSR
eukprot:244783-Hanusia_phi.AAC.4